jgi:perosamine synthetase
MAISLFKPTIKRKDMDSVLTCLVSDQIGPSSLIEDLVDLASENLGTHGGTAVREILRALDILAELLEWEEGDKIIISPLAPRVYHDFFQKRGIVPLYADVNELNGTLDPSAAERFLDQAPRAIFAVHPMGFMDPIEIFSEWEIPLIEDISQSLGAVTNGIKAGSRGDYVLLGMEPHHIITSGGGTLLLTKNEVDSNRLNEILQSLSMECMLPDMNGSLGMVQWAQLNGFLEKRRKLAELFNHSAARSRHGSYKPAENEDPAWYGFPLYLKDSMKEIRQYARKKGIDTALAFSGACIDFIEDKSLCPVASRLAMGTLLFPLYPMMGQKNGELISRVLTTLP